MAKIMLVEDDKSLREIYGVRLFAEGYNIVSAGDGEEALAMAIKERPNLIISDVMMPKISGFDMLDILRSTTETRDIKVIMMTALSSEEQRTRGQSLGADRYLVKSQVGIEDVVKVVHELLGDRPPAAGGNAATAPQPRTAATAGRAAAEPGTAPRQPVSEPVSAATPPPPPVTLPPRPQTPPAAVPARTAPPPGGFTYQSPPAAAQAAAQPVAPAPVAPAPADQTPRPATSRPKIIQPLNDPAVSKVDIKELLDKELAREAGLDLNNRPVVQSTDQERSSMENQIDQFAQEAPSLPQPPLPESGNPPGQPPAAGQV